MSLPPPDIALAELRRQAAAAAPGDAAPFQRFAAPCRHADPIDWLAAQPPGGRLYWQDRDGEITAGAGIAHLVTGRASDCAASFLNLYLRAGSQIAPEIRYFGGFSFDRDAIDDAWAPFDRCRFQLPATTFVCHANGAAEVAITTPVAGSTVPPPARPPTAPAPGVVPDRAGWDQQVTAALTEIAAGRLQKVVLAGRTTINLPPNTDAFTILRRLRTTRDAFVFLFEPTPGVLFLGASPERLYRRDRHELLTEAIAGTRPRGGTPAEDAALAAELLSSDKDYREQQFVLQELLHSLQPLCTHLTAVEPAPVLLPLTSVQHLVQHLQGHLRQGILDHDLLRAIHPTPAVGGLPRAEAVDFRHGVESFCRGWYASPVGWLSPAAAEFAVAIRSALIVGNSLTTYGGAGIVAGSDPAREWAEIQIKQAHLLALAAESAPALGAPSACSGTACAP